MIGNFPIFLLFTFLINSEKLDKFQALLEDNVKTWEHKSSYVWLRGIKMIYGMENYI